ncbi:gliding motility-associated C-terminal domain-containing protein, partial [bacterium]|nr:gliding motility-associated C-terminal domain-containing protein [bacterium]
SGTPQEQGVFDFTLQVMDGTSQAATKELSLSVRQAQGWEMAVGTPTSSDLGSVSMVSATDGWAVGFWGTILHYDGTSWSELSSLTSNLLLSVSMVSATDGWAVGTGSTILRFVGTPPLAPPSDLTAKATFSTQTNLSWQDNSDNEEGFKIERKMAGGVWKEIAIVETNVINYSDSSGLDPNTTCSYRVKAYNAKGDSDYSNETSVTTPEDLSRNLEGVVVYPNPFRPGRGDTSIKFANMTSNVAIRIYNVTGELIRQEENINTGAWEWDGKNDSGQVVATDCYIYIIMNNNGEKTGKICVIR